jgi:hypothetical protein
MNCNEMGSIVLDDENTYEAMVVGRIGNQGRLFSDRRCIR